MPLFRIRIFILEFLSSIKHPTDEHRHLHMMLLFFKNSELNDTQVFSPRRIGLNPVCAFQTFFSKMADLVKGGSNEMPQTDTHWFSESGVIDVFFMMGPAPKDVFSQYAQLTGTTNLPPVRRNIFRQAIL